MPPHQTLHTTLNMPSHGASIHRVSIALPFWCQPNHERQMVGDVARVHLRQRPEPALRRCGWRGDTRRRCVLRVMLGKLLGGKTGVCVTGGHRLRNGARGAVLQNRTQRHRGAQGGTQPTAQPRAGQALPTQRQEIIVGMYAGGFAVLFSQHIRHDRRHQIHACRRPDAHRTGGRSRCGGGACLLARRCAVVEPGVQHPNISLAVSRHW